MPPLTVAQCREIDRTAIDQYGIPGIVLMENAGRGVAEEIERRYAPKGPVVILAGKGNNAGDGFVVARHLHRHGVNVEVLLAAGPDFKGDAKVNFDILLKMGVPILDFYRGGPLQNAPLIIDALLGTGASGEVRSPFREVIEAANQSGCPIVAVDIPSGLDGDTGEIRGIAVRAALTATFIAPKMGFYRGSGPACTGEVAVVDIGIPKEVYEFASSRVLES